MKILVKGKVETVSLDRVKPAQLDNEPAIGTVKQRKAQKNTKNSKNTATVRREPAQFEYRQRRPIVPDATIKQTRVGRKIHTLARFVQMVHALVAPNDIYCRTSCTSRKNYTL